MASRSTAWLVFALFFSTGFVAHVAASCSPGTYSTNNGVTCTACPAGTYQDQSGSTNCKDVQAGWYAAGPGAKSQSQCTPGYYSAAGATQCTICPAGSHCNGYANTQPQLCQPGRYSSQPGAAQDCGECPAGTFSNIYGATACCQCCSGWYTDQTGQTHCFNCPNRGSFQQGYSPAGASSSGQCIAASGATSSCSMSGNTCPTTGGSTPSSAAQKRAQAAKPKSKRCQRGFESCPVFGVLLAHGYGRTYECVDTQNDLESCGGCVDNDSINGDRNIHGGRDCSAIPNVDSVRCSRGRCIIEQCIRGYAVSDDGLRCRPVFRFLGN